MTYKYMSLSKIKEKEPQMRKLKVSEVARSDDWQKKRAGFIARTKASYDVNPTERRKLALQAWAFNPK